MLLKGNYKATGVLEVSDKIRWVKFEGGASGFSPSGLVLDSSNVSGSNTVRYFWPRDADGLMKVHTSKPTSDSDGAIASSTGATTTLNNVASTAIPEDLISDANNTDSLGSNTFSWASLYLGTSLIFKESTNNLTVLATDQSVAARNATIPNLAAHDTFAMLAESQALTTKTYNGLSVTCGTTNAFTLTRGTSTTVYYKQIKGLGQCELLHIPE